MKFSVGRVPLSNLVCHFELTLLLLYSCKRSHIVGEEIKKTIKRCLYFKEINSWSSQSSTVGKKSSCIFMKSKGAPKVLASTTTYTVAASNMKLYQVASLSFTLSREQIKVPSHCSQTTSKPLAGSGETTSNAS